MISYIPCYLSSIYNLYGHLSPISKTIQLRIIRHAESSGEARMNSLVKLSYGLLIMDEPMLADQEELPSTAMHRHSSLEDMPGAMDNRDGRRERDRN